VAETGSQLTPRFCPAHQQCNEDPMAKFNPGQFINEVRAEARKVVWPSRQETVTTAIFVAIMMTILAVFFLGVDTLFGEAVRWLLSLA
jgi:preprotein translocase subunit SecE